MDPLSTNLTHMFCQLFQDALTEYTYAAELAGLGYNIHNTIYGLVVSQLAYVNSIISVLVIMVRVR